MTVSPNRRPRSKRFQKHGDTTGNSFVRRLFVEALERRELMAADLTPFTNTFDNVDVNADGVVSALDVLVVVNRLNTDGIVSLEGKEGNSRGTEGVDVDGDKFLTPLDALMVVNFINSGKADPAEGTGPIYASVKYTFFRVNADGTPGEEIKDIDTTTSQPDIEINVGERVIVRTSVADERRLSFGTGSPTGVFAAYHDISYTNSDSSTAERLQFQWGEYNRLTFSNLVSGGSVTLRYGSALATITPVINEFDTIDPAGTRTAVRQSLEGIFGFGNVGVFTAGTDPNAPDYRISFTGNSSRRDILPEGVIEADNLTSFGSGQKVSLQTLASPNPATDRIVTRAGLNHNIDNGRFNNGAGETDNPRFTDGPEGILIGVGTNNTILRSVGGFVDKSSPQPAAVATRHLGVVDAIFRADAVGLVNWKAS